MYADDATHFLNLNICAMFKSVSIIVDAEPSFFGSGSRAWCTPPWIHKAISNQRAFTGTVTVEGVVN